MTWANAKTGCVLFVICLACYLRASPEEQVVGFAMNQIRTRYVHPVSTRDLVAGALHGCAASLDEYCQYYDWRAVNRLNEEIDRQFGGIGIEVQLDPSTKHLVVASPVPGSPAAKAGIQSGDEILAIEGRPTKDLSLEEATKLMRGEPGTEVRIQLRRYDTGQVVEFTLRRAIVKLSTLLGDRRLPDGSWEYFLAEPSNPKLGYVRISSFAPETARQLDELIARLLQQGMTGLILDLRNDPGGLLEPAIEICDLFIPSGVIVTTRGRGGELRSAIRASGRAKYRDLPLVVLVNQETASAAEIVAACLQDHRRAAVVGQRTFGKGTVQQLINLGNRYGVLKITTATYWRPSNRDINRRPNASEDEAWGVEPDPGLEVKLEEGALEQLNKVRSLRDIANPELARRLAAALLKPKSGDAPSVDWERYSDPQLAKAIERLLQEIRNLSSQPSVDRVAAATAQ
ncbi:MAG: S41 family peptidase [Thermoguttaceae bacterium]|nr:S41 family peptidase [Thermoguttaceae bacterium]MDW8077720.1 S41 family peptidase [Thermoguttaceae bacterium]